jgi:tryptophan halogenase
MDCQGEDSLLSDAAAAPQRIDWRRWLPCDRAVTLSKPANEPPAYSTARAVDAGWQWQIPLRDAVAAGYAYSSDNGTADSAEATLRSWMPAGRTSGARTLEFAPGRPSAFWEGNCLQLAPGRLDPLESTGLHLAQTAITRFLTLFPVHGASAPDIAEYNRLTALEYDRVRDLLTLHFWANARDGSPFWEARRRVELPDTLAAKLELFRATGRLQRLDEDPVADDGWLAVLIGQHVFPRRYDPLADVSDINDTRAALGAMQAAIEAEALRMPTHAGALEDHRA